MKTFNEFILECYNIFEGSEIAGRLADLAQKKADNLFQGNRQWDPNRAQIQINQRIADLARARSLDKPEPTYAGFTIPPAGWAGTPANLPPRRPILSRGGSGSPENNDRDIGTKDKRLLDFVNGRRDNPNMSTRERAEIDRGNRDQEIYRSIRRSRSSKGQSASSAGAGSASGTTGIGKYQVGGGEGYGLLGIKLAN